MKMINEVGEKILPRKIDFTDSLVVRISPRIYSPRRPVLYVSIDELFAGSNPCAEIDLHRPQTCVRPSHTEGPCNGYPRSDCPQYRDPDALDAQTEQIAKDHDDYFWPHKNACPLCGCDAYVGAFVVECSMSSCKNFVYKKGM